MNERSTSAKSDELTVIESEPGHFSFGTWQNIVICLWYRQATGPAVARLEKVVARMSLQNGRMISSVHLIAEHAAMPTAEARTGFIRLMKHYADHLACIGILVTGSGFWASAMSSFLTGIRMLSPYSFDFRIFNTIDQIIDWLPDAHQRKSSTAIDSSRLAEILTSAYEPLREQPVKMAAQQ
jgi:hypothetical protein